MTPKSGISVEKLKELLYYIPETGEFFWNYTLRGHVKKHRPAGSIDSLGYTSIQIDKIKYKCHRLAWLYVYGVWPNDQIDHINLNRSDNRISNLRECNQSQNIANMKIKRTNKSGMKGVYWHRASNKWGADICVNRKRIYLGTFEVQNEAKAAYDAAAIKYFGEFARTA